jgi:hypothetical protein
MMRALAILAAVLLSAACVSAQTDYRNTDSGRPIRVEDTEPIEWKALEFQFTPLKLERLSPNISRWQLEPRVSYGILPRTELEIRAPIVYREATVSPRGGLSGFDVDLLRNINDETPSLPSFAVGAESVFPAGPASTRLTTWAVRALATRTFALVRVHVNAAYGTYNAIVYPVFPPPAGCTSQCGTTTLPPITDSPCDVDPADPPAISPPSRQFIEPTPGLLARLATVTQGHRLYAGLGADHSFSLWSTIVMADVLMERFSGSTSPADWTAELGARHQVTPRLVFDVGGGRRFTGASPEWFATVGTSYTVPTGGIGQRHNCP